MIEAGADEIPDDVMLAAIKLGHEVNGSVIDFINSIHEKEGKVLQEYTEHVIPEDVYKLISEFITDEAMETAVYKELKQERDLAIREITAKVNEELTDAIAALVDEDTDIEALIDETIYKFEKMTVRRMILREHKRPDGRGLEEIRELSAEVDILPRTHGSALFKRGQTQALTVTTLGRYERNPASLMVLIHQRFQRDISTITICPDIQQARLRHQEVPADVKSDMVLLRKELFFPLFPAKRNSLMQSDLYLTL